MDYMLRMVRPAVVILWFWLLYQQYAIPQSISEPDMTSAPVAGGASSYMGVYVGEHKVGYSRINHVSDALGLRFEEQSLLRVTAMGTTQTVRSEIKGAVDPSFALRNVSVAVRSGVGTLEGSGVVTEGVLDIELRVNGERSHQRVAVPNGLYVPAMSRERLVHEGLRVGKELNTEVFDPSSMQTHPHYIRVEALTNDGANGQPALWKLIESFRGMRTTVWMDSAGDVVREEGPMGFVAVREAPEQAIGVGWRDAEPFDLVAAVAVPVHGEIKEPRTAARVELRLQGPEGWSAPTDARQQVTGQQVVITQEQRATAGSYALPYRDQQWRTELSSTALLQVDHPRIVRQAKEIVGTESDAARAVDALRRWVFKSLRKVPTASIPNALQALAMGEGDCNEHAVLFAALARAAGVPARVIAGTVYVDGSFLYHAWNEVWLGNAWVSLDTTMDQMPTDASHVKLLEGGPEEHAALLPLLGNLSVDVIASN